MQQEIERIFRLLNLLHPHLDLHSAYVGLQSTSVAVHDNALEFLDNVLKSQMRDMLVPLLDSKITVAERAQLAQRLVHTNIESQEQAVAELVASEDPWLKSCGAYAIGTLGIKSLEDQLDRCLNESDPLLRETARAAKLRFGAIAGMREFQTLPRLQKAQDRRVLEKRYRGKRKSTRFACSTPLSSIWPTAITKEPSLTSSICPGFPSFVHSVEPS